MESDDEATAVKLVYVLCHPLPFKVVQYTLQYGNMLDSRAFLTNCHFGDIQKNGNFSLDICRTLRLVSILFRADIGEEAMQLDFYVISLRWASPMSVVS